MTRDPETTQGRAAETAAEDIADNGPVAAAPPSPPRSLIRRFAPLGVLAAIVAAVFAFGLDDYVSFGALRDNRMALMAFVETYGFAAVLLFVVIYAAATAASLPGGAIMSFAAGFLFGTWLGTAAIVVGASIGAVIVFLIARTSLGNALRARAGGALRKMEAGFRENEFNYMLVLRLVPLFPFFLVNIVPAFLGVSLRTYALATVIGIIPGSFVFASVGAGLGSVFDAMEDFSPAAALTPEVITALVGLALLSLLPVAYKAWRRRRTTPAT